MPPLKKVTVIDYDIVLSRKKTIFHDAEFKKEMVSKEVILYNPEGTILKSEKVNFKKYTDYRIIEEYEDAKLIHKMKFDKDVTYRHDDFTYKYDSEENLIESTSTFKETKYVYRYQTRKWREDGWYLYERIAYVDKYEYDIGWKLKRSEKSFKETSSMNPEKTQKRWEVYYYPDGIERLQKHMSYVYYYDIEGNTMKKECYDGVTDYYDNYNSHGDFEIHRISYPDGTKHFFKFRYDYDYTGRLISKSCYRDGTEKIWEIVRILEYW